MKSASPFMSEPPIVMPPPGAVCPAMVRYGFETCNRDWFTMLPPTRNTQVRGPLASTHARSDPFPESFRFVTSITTPPRPPTAAAPPPSAPGNAGQFEPLHDAFEDGPDAGSGVGVDAVTVTVAEANLLASALLVAVTLSIPAFAGAV